MRISVWNLALAGALGSGLCAGTVSADLLWFTDGTVGSEIVDASGTPLDASVNDPLTGDFLQLIKAPGGVIHPAVIHSINPQGISGDNEVADSAYFGYLTDDFISPRIDGHMQNFSVAGTFSPGDTFFVRAWTEPASDFASSSISMQAELFYNDSKLYTYTGVDATSPDDEFVFNAHNPAGAPLEGFAATLSPIPEPTTLVMLLLGCLGLFGRGLRSRS